MGLTGQQMDALASLDMRAVDLKLHAWANCLEKSEHHNCETCEERTNCQEPAKLKDMLELIDIVDGLIELVQTLR